MTESVVTASPDAPISEVAGLMRDRNVGSVVICDGGRPVALITDRDVAIVVAADGVGSSDPVGPHATHPIVTGELGMDLEEAAALMVQHRIRRLPLMDGDGLAGVVTLDDPAVRPRDPHPAPPMTAPGGKAALAEVFFHPRG